MELRMLRVGMGWDLFLLPLDATDNVYLGHGRFFVGTVVQYRGIHLATRLKLRKLKPTAVGSWGYFVRALFAGDFTYLDHMA